MRDTLPIARYTTACPECPRLVVPGQAFVTYRNVATHPECVPAVCQACFQTVSKAGKCGCYDEQPVLETP